jgi:hypothetical protein
MEEAEAVLEALSIANLCLERKGLIAHGQLKFQFDDLRNGDVTGNHSANPAFAQVFAAAMQYFSCSND